jgi:flavin-dependent dehydrogenase
VPRRATKRGAERTPLDGHYDVLICGASFAGLAVARELRGTGARVLVLDRYEIGEKQTSACAAPTALLEHMGLGPSIKQTFARLVMHTPRQDAIWPIPFTFSTFDYRRLCELLWEQCGDAEFDTAKVDGRTGDVVHTDRGDVSAPLIVDALGWRRVLSNGPAIQPPEATLSRGLEVHPHGSGPDLELWLEPRYVSPGYAWAFAAGDEMRIGVGAYDPRVHVKDPTVRLAADTGFDAVRYQGNWIPHRLRPAAEDGVFFVGDSAGHCFPVTAEGIRPALVFGVIAGREIRAVLEGGQTRDAALRRYAHESADRRHTYEFLYRMQQLIRHVHGPLLDGAVWLHRLRAVSSRNFGRYLDAVHPDVALPAPPAAVPARRHSVAA